jgi:rsbT co-antagonist protein RsbR
MTREEIFAEIRSYTTTTYCLETGSVEALQAHARDPSERIIKRVETHEVLGIVLLLRDARLLAVQEASIRHGAT